MIIAVSGLTEDAQGNKGSAGAGKSEVAKHLVEKHGFVEIALADPIKRAAMEWWGFTEEQLWGSSPMRNEPDKRYLLEASKEFLTPRQALQQIGTEVARAIDPDVWVRNTLRVATELLSHVDDVPGDTPTYNRTKGVVHRCLPRGLGRAKGVVISDLRFENEKAGVEAAGGKCWRKKRKVDILPGHDGKHVSETDLLSVPDAEFDGIFPDTDLNHLHMLIDSVMDVYTGRIMPYDPAQADIPPFLRRK